MIEQSINYKLDIILATCCNRCSRAFENGEWDAVAKEVAGSDHHNPMFVAYLDKLKKDDYIEDAIDGEGCMATIDGLDFWYWGGYVKAEVRRTDSELRLENLKTLESRIREKEIKYAVWLAVLGFFPSLYYFIELCKTVCHHYHQIQVWSLWFFH